LFFAAVTIVGQSAYWIANAQWPPVNVIAGLAVFGFGPMHSELKGLDLILSYVNASPFSVSVAVAGIILFAFMSMLAQRQRS
jgi:ABC-type sulfate transport system permease subunit